MKTLDVVYDAVRAGRLQQSGQNVMVYRPRGDGPYEKLGATHDAIVAWSRQNGYRLAGTCWEIYGDWEEDSAKLRTDIFHLLAPQP